MTEYKKTSASAMLMHWQVGAVALAPLVVRSCVVPVGPRVPDARVELALPNEVESYRFAVEIKSLATPQMVHAAMLQAQAQTSANEWPLIHVPYLSPERLEELEAAGVSGVDLCGNGLVMVPGRLFIKRSGLPNIYRDSRPLNNPYRGLSALVARMLVQQPKWPSLSTLATAIHDAGATISLAQTSKAVRALCEDMVVTKQAGVIHVREPLRLLDQLGAAWRKNPRISRHGLRLSGEIPWTQLSSAQPQLSWAISGASSVNRYASFAESGPRCVIVSNLHQALQILGGKIEPVPQFADVMLMESKEPGYYFANEVDNTGKRWASRLQTWLELQAGDARQQAAAQDVRQQLLSIVKS
jgi:hypothetical protein